MIHHQYPPHPLLQGYVKCLWVSKRDFEPPNDQFELLPDTNIELVFSFGGRCQSDDGQAAHDLPRGYVMGLLDKPLRLRGSGLVKTVAARFFAWGFYPLFQNDLSLAPNAVHHLDPVWQQLIYQIGQAIEQDDDEAAVGYLHDALIARVLKTQFDSQEVQSAAQRLADQGGQMKVSALADDVYYSHRQMERKFKQQIGMSAKALARKMRFERARDLIIHDPDTDLSRIAQDCGYADQAHFSNDFKAFSNKSPAQFAREMAALREVMRANYHVVFLQD